MKKIKKFIWNWKRNDIKYINGYATFMALCCFALLMQIVLFTCLYTKEKVYLLSCQKQSIIDLNVLDAAKEIINHNQFVSRCNRPDEERIMNKHIRYKDYDMYFEDGYTYLNCTYKKENKSFVYTFYYDEHAIVSMKIQCCNISS